MAGEKPEITVGELYVIINERDRAYTQRFESQERAVNKAEIAAEKRLDAVNEFRGQLKDQAATFVTRTELYAGLVAGLTLAIASMQLFVHWGK